MNVSRNRFLRAATIRPDTAACFLCQWRSFRTSYRQLAEKPAPSPASTTPPPATTTAAPPPLPAPGPLDGAPRSYGKSVEDFTPKPLSRPIGMPKPPRPGENTGIDPRSLKQRRADFVNYDKHLIRRKELTHKISTPYFREWSNMRHHKGKSFFAPPRLFKAEKSLYFPNFFGQTLSEDQLPRDTTPLFQDMVSVVSVFSSQWAENQAATFVSEKNNPELHEVVKSSGGLAQLVKINIEENAMKAWLVKLFMGNLRKRVGANNWGRYFLVRKGITEEIRDAVGLLNSKVGYTYLVDGDCRIRWAGSGPCEGEEKDGLVKGTRRLIEELTSQKMKEKLTPLPTKQITDTTGTKKSTAPAA